MKTIKTRLIFSAMLFLCSCYSVNQTRPATTATDTQILSPVPSVPTMPDNSTSLLTYQEVLQQIYGKDVDINPNNEAFVMSAEGIKYSAQINMFSCYWDVSAVETCLVVIYKSQCLDCGGYIDGATFNRAQKGWNLVTFRSNIAAISSNVRVAPKGEIIQIGPEKRAVQIKWMRSNAGGSLLEYLVIISEPSFDVILDIVSRGESRAPENKIEYGWNTNLYFQQSSENSEYYDLVVTYYGDVINMPYSEFYFFSNGKYDTLIPKEK